MYYYKGTFQFPGISASFPLTPSYSFEDFQDLINYLKIFQDYDRFELIYKRNQQFFKDSLDLPENLPKLPEVELFWLKMNAKIHENSSFNINNISFLRESTFLLWLLSILEVFWQRPFFELVISNNSLIFSLKLKKNSEWQILQRFVPWIDDFSKIKFHIFSMLKTQHYIKRWSCVQDELLKSAIR